MSLAQSGRRQEILGFFAKTHRNVVCLQGTRDRIRHDRPYEVSHVSEYIMLSAGYGRGANKHAGVAVCLWKGSFTIGNIIGIAYPDDIRLQGRGLVVRTCFTDRAVFECEKNIIDKFEDKEFSCGLCDTNCFGLSSYHWHIRTHLVSPEHIVLCDEDGSIVSSIINGETLFEKGKTSTEVARHSGNAVGTGRSHEAIFVCKTGQQKTEGSIGGNIGKDRSRRKGIGRIQTKGKGISKVGGSIEIAKGDHWHGESTEGIGKDHEVHRAEGTQLGKKHSESHHHGIRFSEGGGRSVSQDQGALLRSKSCAGSSSRVLQHVKPVAQRGKGDHIELSMLQLSRVALSERAAHFGCATHGSKGQLVGRIRARLGI